MIRKLVCSTLVAVLLGAFLVAAPLSAPTTTPPAAADGNEAPGNPAAFRSITAGSNQTCALSDNGTVRCWGANGNGQLGLGDTVARGDGPGEMGDSLPAVNLGTGRTATAITAGGSHTCALLDNGTVKCWGYNYYGQLGLGDTVNRGDGPGEMGDSLPAVNLGTGRTATAITAGSIHTCARLDNGTVKCWGYNVDGRLGLGDTVNRGDQPGEMGDSLPAVNLGTGRTATAITAGVGHTCALLDNATVKCWGNNSYGGLGLGDTAHRGDGPGEMGDSLPAVSLGTGRTATAVTVGQYHSCALLDDATVKCWGYNTYGELGQGDTTHRGDGPGEMGDSLPAVNLGTGRTATAVTAGSDHTCARLDNATVKCWGYNGSGQLGQGDTAHRGDGPGEMGDSLPAVALFTPAPAATISKNADEGTVVAGAVIHYHVRVTNTGNVPLTGVTVADAKAPACAGALADIAVGANRVVGCNYTSTPSDIGLYANTASVDTNETDAVTSNTATVNVTAAAQSETPPDFVRTWGTAGGGNGELNAPLGVAIGVAGNIFVADQYNQRIQKFSAQGTYLTQWGTAGTGDGQFNAPVGVAVGPSGVVYVTDYANNRVQQFTSDGVYVRQWGSAGTGDGQFNGPWGVAVNSAGDVFVTDRLNNRVQQFTAIGTYVRQWGTTGSGNGQFGDPRGIAVGNSDELFVADSGNNRVERFTSTGTFVTAWGNTGSANGQFNGPRGIGVDADGDVYVGDQNNHRVQKYSASGTFVTTWGTSGITHGRFQNPVGIAVTGHTVYVVDQGNNRIQQFAPAPSPTEVPPVFVRAWGGTGSGDGQFNAPDAVGVSPATGDVYVADRGNHRIQQFTREGVFVRAWGTNGTANGQFREPSGVAVSTGGDVYVAEKLNNRVQQFTATGTWVRTFGTGILTSPEGIAVGPSGNVYVADAGHNKIQRFTADGTFTSSIGAAGSGNGQLSYAQGVAVYGSSIYVADTYNRRVEQFLNTGAYVRGWGISGSGNGQFQEVDGLAITPGGNVVVTDPNNTRLQTFTGTGAFVTTWGTAGTGDGQFVAPSPADVAVSPDGWVYTVDRTNNRIQEFAPSVIRGTVTETGTAASLAGTWIVALRAADYHLIGGTTTAADGTYRLPVTPGSYRLEFADPAFHHDIEWYDNHPFDQLGASNPVTATLGAATTGIDAGLFLPTGTIAGTVTEAGTGTPLADAAVAVMSTDDAHPYSADLTATNGTYRVTGLPAGDYWVVAALADGTHQPTFRGGTHTPTGATVVTVTANTTTPGADIAMTTTTHGPPTAGLTGTITDKVTGDNEPNVVVAALRAADFGFTVATFTDTAGHYSLTVPPGDYYLEFFDITHGHEFEWYQEQPHPTSPGDLTAVTAPGTASEHLIPLHGTAAGTVTDTSTSQPLPGIWVAVMSATDGHGVAGTTTDSTGHYTLPDLDLGDYYLVFIDPTGRHDYELHDNTPDMGAATPITITGSHTTTTDAALTPTT